MFLHVHRSRSHRRRVQVDRSEEPEGAVDVVPSMTSEKRVGVLPAGVKVAPDAARALEKALDALQLGLVASAWSWTEKARAELDALTDGVGVQVEGQADGD